MQFKGKLMSQTWKNGEKTKFRPDFGPKFLWVSLSLDDIHCYKPSSYAISIKTNEPNLRKWHKTGFGPEFGLFGSNSPPPPQFFFQSLDITVSYHHVQHQKKNNDPILRKRTDGQTDENDFIGCRSVNVERPTKNIFPCFKTDAIYT